MYKAGCVQAERKEWIERKRVRRTERDDFFSRHVRVEQR